MWLSLETAGRRLSVALNGLCINRSGNINRENNESTFSRRYLSYDLAKLLMTKCIVVFIYIKNLRSSIIIE